MALQLLAGAPLAADSCSDLLKDLLIVEACDQRLNDRIPVHYNYLLQGGYFAMPSARMGQAGELAFGYASPHPYRLWNLRCQLTSHLEISGNYRIFNGIKDPVLSRYGFGDFSDKGANIKIALFHPEDSDCQLPGLAIGFEDVIGTRAFKGRYIALTQLWLERDAEITIGYGHQRIKGLFGAAHWMPFRRKPYSALRSLSLCVEYDATPYRKRRIEPHPQGRKQRSAWNVGLKYRLGNYLDFTYSYMRGVASAFAVSTFYNFGTTEGFVPKVDAPLCYTAPVNIEPVGSLRPEGVVAQDLFYGYKRQKLEVLEQWLGVDKCGKKILRLRIANQSYRFECDVRRHLDNLVAYLTPSDIDEVIVAIDCEGVLIQEYRYRMPFVRRFANQQISPYELRILSPLCEASFPNRDADWQIFRKAREPLCLALMPKSYSCFGSAKGKFKYALGIAALASGYLDRGWYYTATLGWIGPQNISGVGTVDRLNPSQLINVRTDIIRYYQQKGVTLDEAYLQKTWNISRALYGRLSLGYFEVEYGGAAAEVLYYPLQSPWAFGIEGALLRKRAVGSWWNFTGKIRQLDGFKPHYRKFLGSQFFLSLYYKWDAGCLDVKIKAGKFLANDYGVRYELSKYFPSGMRLTLWYTRTNGHDRINCQTYYDKGVALSLPLDLFYTYCDRQLWTNSLSAWLRDVGVTAYTGPELYYMISDQRAGYRP